jgi:hypothetical protein
MSELAFTVNGDTFEVPNTVTAWRVRRLKPRGAPELVYARDGRPLTLPIEADLDDLHEAVTTSGKYRLDPIGDDGKGVENVPAAYIHVTKGERNAAPEHAIERVIDPRVDSTIAGLGQAVIEAVKLNAEAMRQNAEISMRAVDRLPQLMEAVTAMLNVAAGTQLYALQQRELPPAKLRNAANDNSDDGEDDEEDIDDEDAEGIAAPPTIGGFPLPPGFDINKIVAQVAFDVVSKLMDKFSGKMPSVGAILDPRKAYEEGQRERAAQAVAQQAPVSRVTPPMHAPRASTAMHAPPRPVMQPAAASVVPTDPVSLAHFYAVKSALTPDEQTLVVAIAQELCDEERGAWFNELLPLSVPDAVAKVRATLAQVEGYQPPSASLTAPPPNETPAPTAATSPQGSPTTRGTQGQSRAS